MTPVTACDLVHVNGGCDYPDNIWFATWGPGYVDFSFGIGVLPTGMSTDEVVADLGERQIGIYLRSDVCENDWIRDIIGGQKFVNTGVNRHGRCSG